MQRDDGGGSGGGDPRELVRGVKERNHSVFNRKRETGNESKRETRTPETKAASKTNKERNTSNWQHEGGVEANTVVRMDETGNPATRFGSAGCC